MEEQTVLEEQVTQEEQAAQAPVKKTKKKVVISVISAILAAVIGFGVFWFLTADDRLYAKGVSYMENGDYAVALEIFLELADHKDSPELVKKCHYGLADSARLRQFYDLAREHYIAAGDYQDSAFQAQRMIYTMGHQAFVRGDYEEYEAWFEQLEVDASRFGAPHFRDLEEAAPFIMEQRETMPERINFYLGEMPESSLVNSLRNGLPYHYAYLQYFAGDKEVLLDTIVYYPGDRIYAAWEKGDTTALTEQEQQVLTLALQLVEQAKAQTETNLELQLWLHDWLCKQVAYESPNMEVKRVEYLELTELSCIGAMLEGKANCQGYTDAFGLLGRLAGLEVSRQFGVAGEGHTWNIIRLDGLWYIMDVTFDDMSDGGTDAWNYTYFNTGWDREVYEVFGGDIFTPDMAEDVHPTQNYFAHTQNTFTSASDAAYDLVSQALWEGKKWAYVKIDGTVVDVNSFGNTLYNTVARRISWSISWQYWVYDYNGDSYIIVQWN